MYAAFTYLEKAHEKLNRKTLWELLILYSLHGRLLNAMKMIAVVHLREKMMVQSKRVEITVEGASRLSAVTMFV